MINFKLEKFEGPLNLLLKLIEKEELDITEVSLAKIADQYVEYIKIAGVVNTEMTADFLVVAAKLLYIKSKALLPYLHWDEEEEEDLEELERQLKMYKEFLEATKKIEVMIGKKKFMFEREFNRKAVLSGVNMFSPPKELKSQDLRDIFSELLTKIRPADEELETEKIEHKISIEEQILHIQNSLIEKISISFSKLIENAGSKSEVIVNFLAMLELMKQHNITVEQENLFSDIFIQKYEQH